MQLPKLLTTVTPFSKYLSMVLFVIFPLIGFYAGAKYQSLRIIPVNTMEKINNNDCKKCPPLQPTTIIKADNQNSSLPSVSPTIIASQMLSPTIRPALRFTLTLPQIWKSSLPTNGVIHNDKDEKIGEIEGVRTYENSCLNYFGKRFTDDSMEKKLGQWEQKIEEKTWYVVHIDVPCLGECNWNLYCTEGENKIFTVYFSNSLAQQNPDLIKETLSTFSFID